MPGELPTSIRLPREIKAALQRAANERKWSLTQMIGEVIKQWLEWDRQRRSGK